MMPFRKQCGMGRKTTPPPAPTGLYYARAHRGMSQDDLVKASGVPKGTISKLERANEPHSRELTRTWAEKFAAALNMSAERILFWDKYGAPEDPSHIPSEEVAADLSTGPVQKMVKIKGYVGASSEAQFYRYADETFEEVPAPSGANDQTIALEIKGKSLGPRFDTWLVFYDDVRSPVTDDLIGELCVVGLADDRIVVKEIQRNRRGGYTLLSNTDEPPIENAEIEWAAKVTDLKPRR